MSEKWSQPKFLLWTEASLCSSFVMTYSHEEWMVGF